MSRLCRVLLAVAIVAAITAPSAAAVSERELSTTLGDVVDHSD
jgi:hypothetical protein